MMCLDHHKGIIRDLTNAITVVYFSEVLPVYNADNLK